MSQVLTPPAAPIPLGAFTLLEPIGRGGMGSVWRARHRDVPVAVKILDTQVTEEELEVTFKNEVRAVTRLDHPGVVWVYDIGQVDADAAKASAGRLAAGCPFIAMEYASRGTLRDWGRLPWEGVREVLLALLDALAHAHARGVIHQDLKPANVLVCGPEDIRPGLKLADFGIAHAMQGRVENRAARTAVGTVQYMAPEQIRSETWDCGPWTDIYSVGNVAWQLLTGAVPFAAYSGVALVRAQLEEDLPTHGLRVPGGFRDWLGKCLAKDPADRFARCADAADALLDLPDVTDDGGLRASDQNDRLPTIRVEEDDGGPGTSPMGDDVSPVTGLPEGLELATAMVALNLRPPHRVTTAPTGRPAATARFGDWRRLESPRRSLQLLGAGLHLWYVRRSPMLGRVDERDLLWERLRRVTERGLPEVVVITGAAGTGKSRLAGWLTERASELAVATPLKTRFFPGDTDGPLRRMWARHLRMGEVESGNRGKWLTKSLRRLGIEAGPEQYAVLVGPGDAAQRHRRTESMLRAMTVDRPVVLQLDDVHVGPDGLRLARHLLSAAAPLPVLVVLCARSEALVDRPDERGMLEALVKDGPDGRVTELAIGPLPERDHVTLVEEVLGLSPALAAQVSERTGGNPMFVLELIGDWISRGILELGPTGFDVRPGEVATLPREVSDAWTQRIDRVLAGLPPSAEWQLERAAALGLTVRQQDWAVACDDPSAAGIAAGAPKMSAENERVRRALVDRLCLGRLAEADGHGGFTFAHGMIREAIVGRAGPRLVEHHRAAAAVLPYLEDPEPAAERIGHHLLEAGDLEAALGPVLLGAVHRRDTSGPRSALGMLARAEAALRQLGTPPNDARWAEVWQLSAMFCAELGEIGEATRHATRVVQGEREAGWLPHVLDARLTLARIHAARSEFDAAEEQFRAILQQSDDPVQQGLTHAERALVSARTGDREGARASTDQAVRLLRQAASSRALAECWRLVGTTALIAGNDRQAEDALSRGLRLYKLRGNVIGQAECLAGLGRVSIRKRDRELAEQRLREAIHLWEVAGNGDVVRARADLARIRIEQDRFDEARDLLANLRLIVSRQGRVAVLEGLGAMQLAAAAGCMDWEEFEHRLARIEEDPKIEAGGGAWALQIAVELAEGAGFAMRARRVRALL
ncbi:MAG: protein kinase [Myxococcota bacterium]